MFQNGTKINVLLFFFYKNSHLYDLLHSLVVFLWHIASQYYGVSNCQYIAKLEQYHSSRVQFNRTFVGLSSNYLRALFENRALYVILWIRNVENAKMKKTYICVVEMTRKSKNDLHILTNWRKFAVVFWFQSDWKRKIASICYNKNQSI